MDKELLIPIHIIILPITKSKTQRKVKSLKKLKILCMIAIISVGIAGCTKDNANKNTESNQDSAQTESESIKSDETESKEKESEKETKKEVTPDTKSTGEEKNVEKSTNDVGSQNNIDKQAYLDALQYAYDLEDKVQTAETQTDMNINLVDAMEAWDDELNKIYGLLRDKLSESDMKKLEAQELQWIETRDEEVDKAGKQYEGGSMESFQRGSASMELTKLRTLELIDLYFDN